MESFFGWSGLVLGLLGVLLAVVFCRRAARDKEPVYSYTSRTIIENPNPEQSDMQVLYKGASQSRVTVVSLALWNRGKSTINETDTVQEKPLEIRIPNTAELLDVQIDAIVEETNNFSLGSPIYGEKFTSVPIHFKYIDHGEGLRVQLVHNSVDSTRIFVSGKIRGSQRLRHLNEHGLNMRGKPSEMKKLEMLITDPEVSAWFVTGTLALIGTVGLYYSIAEGRGGWYWALVGGCYLLSYGIYSAELKSSAPRKIRPKKA